MTERIRSQIEVVKMSFLRMMSGLSLRDKERRLVTRGCSEQSCWLSPLVWEHLGILKKGMESVAQDKEVLVSLLDLLHLRPDHG